MWFDLERLNDSAQEPACSDELTGSVKSRQFLGQEKLSVDSQKGLIVYDNVVNETLL